ncbi:hypothetical protein GJ744_003523 [Endocarpon pusillum]|uniref:Uncharacterized protein n=1 Tax=Endocarpon pusillum TaxID=364733 RepID=A0A8H7ARS9_9EURO|nr:hypothetical protein GJ744_003523 [Endocarpon pusillum]
MHFATLFVTASAALLLPTIIATPVLSPLAPVGLARRGEVLARENAAHDLYLKDDDDHKIWAELEKVFSTIEEIPDEVLEKGDDETDKWLVEHGYRAQHDKRDLEDRDFFDVAKCVAAITAFVGSNAIAAAKILRIKRYINSLGGIRKSAELLLKASNAEERLKYGGEALALLAGEILGTAIIANNC